MSIALKLSKAQKEIFFPKDNFPKYSIVRKGRRTGLTRGAAIAMILYASNKYPFFPNGDLFFMWGDTVSANIDRYYERYFFPILKQMPYSVWSWQSAKRILKVGRVTIDFRSADRPENWEGFGYHLIFLNEAGIILDNDYLYDNAVLPMLMDYPNAKLIAAGVPKGKRTKNGIHKFYKLYEASLIDTVNYRSLCYPSYSNPFIPKSEIDLLASIYDETNKDQEIYGKFVDVNEKAFLYAFDEEKHTIAEYKVNPHLPLLISFDFNKEPMTCLVAQQPDYKSLVIFDEIRINAGSTPEVCERILAKYPQFLFKMDVTGDATGRNRTAMVRGNINHYQIIKSLLQLQEKNLLVPMQNPSHINNRVLCNSVLQNITVKILKSCQETINDCKDAFVDDTGELVKTQSAGRHFLDNVRYLIEAAFPDFISKPYKYVE